MEEMPYICLIGHGEYSLKMRSKEMTLPFGEVNNARKLHSILKANGLPVSEVWDIYELFEIDEMSSERGELFWEMLRTNIDLGNSGIDFITDFNNSLAKTFRKNVAKKVAATQSKKNVLFFLSWPGIVVAMLSTGIQHDFPVIGKDDSYIKASHLLEPFPMEKFSKEVQLLISESLMGAVNCNLYNIALSKFLYLPNLSPPEALQVRTRTDREKNDFRKHYLNKVAEENGKKIVLNEQTLIIGCPSRCIRRKNVDLLIHTVAKLFKKHPNLLLLLKGDMASELDLFSQYSEKLYQLIQSVKNEPWFLWDRAQTPYPDVLCIYDTFDICALLSGAELGSNTVIEVSTLGTPTLILDASVNPYLYKGICTFVRGGKPCNAPWIYQQPSLDELEFKLEELINNREMRKRQSDAAVQLGEQRFGFHQILERIPLAAKAAWSFFHKDPHEKEYQKMILERLEKDLKEHQIEEELLPSLKGVKH